MNKKKRNIIITISTMLVVIILTVIIGVFAIKNYIAKTPKINLKGIDEVEALETITVDDLAWVECKGDYHTDISIVTEIGDAKVSEDKQSLYVGSSSGCITVVITAVGSVHESVSEETTIYVSLGEQERKDFIEKANDTTKRVEEYILKNGNYPDMQLEQAIYFSTIYAEDDMLKENVADWLELKYKKEDNTYFYLHTEVSDEDIVLSEDNYFENHISIFDPSSTPVWWVNIGDGIYHIIFDRIPTSQPSDSEYESTPSRRYIYLIDYTN